MLGEDMLKKNMWLQETIRRLESDSALPTAVMVLSKYCGMYNRRLDAREGLFLPCGVCLPHAAWQQHYTTTPPGSSLWPWQRVLHTKAFPLWHLLLSSSCRALRVVYIVRM